MSGEKVNLKGISVIPLLDVEAMRLDGAKSSHPELFSAGTD